MGNGQSFQSRQNEFDTPCEVVFVMQAVVFVDNLVFRHSCAQSLSHQDGRLVTDLDIYVTVLRFCLLCDAFTCQRELYLEFSGARLDNLAISFLFVCLLFLFEAIF